MGRLTEGWIAGLQLAALSMRGSEDVSGFVESFSGGNRDVLDFLVEEVLEGQPEGVKDFLLKTSVLERMSAPLCDALTGRGDGQGMLEDPERKNLFVVALDDGRRWYRYLFAAFLRERLRRADPDAVAELHRRAALWHEGDGSRNEAIENFLAAGDFGRAGGLVEGKDGGRVGYADAPAVISWQRAPPDGLVRRRPRLCLIFARALVFSGELAEAEGLLEAAEMASKPEGDPPAQDLSDAQRKILGEVCVARARIAAIRGDAALTVRLCGRALDLLPEGEPRLRGEAALDLGLAHGFVGNLDASGEALSLAACAGSTDDLRTVLYATRFRATLEVAGDGSGRRKDCSGKANGWRRAWTKRLLR